MQNTDEGKKISSFLGKKLALFKQYLSITERMKETIISDAENNIVGFVNKRQDCINKINKIDRSIEKMVKTSDCRFQNISSKFKGSLDGYVHDIKGVMEEMVPIEKEMMRMVAEEKESVKTEILRRQNARNAISGYRNNARHSAKFLDTKK
jgi:hypothetical protein